MPPPPRHLAPGQHSALYYLNHPEVSAPSGRANLAAYNAALADRPAGGAPAPARSGATSEPVTWPPPPVVPPAQGPTLPYPSAVDGTTGAGSPAGGSPGAPGVGSSGSFGTDSVETDGPAGAVVLLDDGSLVPRSSHDDESIGVEGGVGAPGYVWNSALRKFVPPTVAPGGDAPAPGAPGVLGEGGAWALLRTFWWVPVAGFVAVVALRKLR